MKDAELFSMKSLFSSIQSGQIMYEKNELKILLKHNEDLNIRFINLYGILEQFS